MDCGIAIHNVCALLPIDFFDYIFKKIFPGLEKIFKENHLVEIRNVGE